MSQTHAPHTPRPPDARTQRAVLVPPFAFFAATLVLALCLAVLNARYGSLNLLPGESLWLPATIFIVVYAMLLNGHLLRAGLALPERARIRHLLVAVSTLVAAPVLGLLVAPALNGLIGAGPERIAVVRVAGIETSHVSRSARLHYYARLDSGAAPLPPGRYFMGRYDEAWELPATSAPPLQIVQVSVRYRTGLLGARTLLEVVPAGVGMQ